MSIRSAVLINEVLPEGSVLYKHNHGSFSFYLTDDNFRDGNSFLDQKPGLAFIFFIDQIVMDLMELEEDHAEPITKIDYAIASTKLIHYD